MKAADSPLTAGGSMRRVSSPASFSTCPTSAPMSASMRPHTGPAMMCASSTTRQPLRGPPAISASLPVRLALGEKGFEAFAEVLAGVAEDDEVFVVDLGRGGGQPAQRLLGLAQGERRLSRQQRSQPPGALLDGRLVGQPLGDEAEHRKGVVWGKRESARVVLGLRP